MAMTNHQTVRRLQLRSVCLKTKMCKFFITGQCTKEDQCMYAHSKDELKPAPNLSRTKVCPSLAESGFCTTKDCPYAHDRSEIRTVRLAKQSASGQDRTAEQPRHLQESALGHGGRTTRGGTELTDLETKSSTPPPRATRKATMDGSQLVPRAARPVAAHAQAALVRSQEQQRRPTAAQQAEAPLPLPMPMKIVTRLGGAAAMESRPVFGSCETGRGLSWAAELGLTLPAAIDKVGGDISLSELPPGLNGGSADAAQVLDLAMALLSGVSVASGQQKHSLMAALQNPLKVEMLSDPWGMHRSLQPLVPPPPAPFCF